MVLAFVVAIGAFAEKANGQGMSLWERLMTPNNELRGLNQTAATVNATAVKTTAGVDTTYKAIELDYVVPEPELAPAPVTGGCGQTMTPFGKINETIRCDGRNWVAANNLLNNGVNVGVGTNPDARMKLNINAGTLTGILVRSAAALTSGQSSITGSNTSDGMGIFGVSDHGIGVLGQGETGVKGESFSVNGNGVIGRAEGNAVVGVRGLSDNDNGYGVVGENTGGGIGVKGVSDSAQGIGVNGTANSGVGVKGTGGDKGVYGVSLNSGSTGVAGLADGAGARGVYGSSNGTNGTGVMGQSDSPTGVGVVGLSTSPGGKGIRGAAEGINSVGVEGIVSYSIPNSPNPAIAVKAVVSNPSDGSWGFYQSGRNARNLFEGGLMVGGSYTVGSTAQLQVDGGLQILASPMYNQPVCQEVARGTFWFAKRTSGLADSAEVCAKNADGTYAWKNLF